jgi:SAM-dependent methyltransferase
MLDDKRANAGSSAAERSTLPAMSGDHANWPGANRRHPRRSSSTWVVRAALARWLQAQASELEGAGEPMRILDVGCGVKPYYPFFASVASSYVGVDVVENPVAELLGPVEDLPVEDASFDVVLCTQVLEHSDDPAQAVRELRRVTAPGGRVLASTHGVQVYHPSPVDYWRWTHEGLRRLFTENAEWSALSVEPAAGTASTLAMLLATYIEIGLRRSAFARPPVSLLNRAGAALDARSARLREPVPGSLTANLHVVGQP